MPGYQPRHNIDRVFFDGTQVNDTTVATNQTGVLITAIYGWDERPDVRDVRELRAGQDGENVDNLYLGGRTVTVEGEVYGSSWADLQTRKRALAALFQPSADEKLFKVSLPSSSSPTGTYATTGMTDYERISARVIESIQFGDTLDPSCQTFQVVLRASDPRVYSDVATSTDSGTSGTATRTVTVDQGGTYPTPPTLTLSGPTDSAIRVREPSSGLNLNLSGLTMVANDTLEIRVQDRVINYSTTYENTRLIRSGLKALWMLDETSGTTADNEEGTAAYDGTYTGGFTLNQTGFATNIASVDLNGTTGYVSTTYQAALATVAFSVEAWVRQDAAGDDVIVSSVSSTGFKGFDFEVKSDGSLYGAVYNTGALSALDPSGYARSAANMIKPLTWYHVVMTNATVYSAPRIYINGTDVSATRVYNTGEYYGPSTAQGIQIGRRAYTTTPAYFDGRISAVAYYNRELSSAEIVSLYSARTKASTTSAYTYLVGGTANWANLGTASSTYSFDSGGLNTGSKLNVSYRDSRL